MPDTARRSRSRKVGTRGEPRPVILIVCEGEKTEPNYFRAFRVSSAIVLGLGRNTSSLVDEALRLRTEHGVDNCWCVFDRDSFPANSVNAAHAKAEAAGCKVAISNECFELWYLLHFDYFDAALSRTQYSDKLETRLGKKYEKNSVDMYDDLFPKQQTAIRNAKRLLSQYEPLNPADNNPVTTVHLLVEVLNGHLARQEAPKP